MTRLWIAGAALIMVAVPAGAAMTVQTFLTRADALKAQGPMALMSPDFPILKTEAQNATAALKADRDVRKAAGKPPIACPPEGQSIGIMQMLDGLAGLSPTEKRLPLKDGYAKVLAKTYPCH